MALGTSEMEQKYQYFTLKVAHAISTNITLFQIVLIWIIYLLRYIQDLKKILHKKITRYYVNWRKNIIVNKV